MLLLSRLLIASFVPCNDRINAFSIQSVDGNPLDKAYIYGYFHLNVAVDVCLNRLGAGRFYRSNRNDRLQICIKNGKIHEFRLVLNAN